MGKSFQMTPSTVKRSIVLVRVLEHLEAQLTLLLNAGVSELVLEAAGPQLLPVLQLTEVPEISGCPWVDGSPLDVPLAVAQRGPALHLLSEPILMQSILADVAEDLELLARDLVEAGQQHDQQLQQHHPCECSGLIYMSRLFFHSKDLQSLLNPSSRNHLPRRLS